jgi:hypothetical protein
MQTKLRVPKTPEYLRSEALREAPRISSFGWRPTNRDLEQLQASTQDAIAYRTYARGWRRAGFKTIAIKRLAGRAPRRP